MTLVRHQGPRRSARGSVLVEFALVSLAFYLLLAAIVAFGMQLHTAQVAQDAARLGARELALTPLAAGVTFDDALANDGVRTAIYDRDALVIDLDNLSLGGPQLSLDTYFAGLPSVNRALRPLMIYDEIFTSNTAKRRVLRVPGALVLSLTPLPERKPWFRGFTVIVPSVLSRDAEGRETIEWLSVIEEVRVDRTVPLTGPFSVLSSSPVKGLVALRVNVPVQSSAMAAFQPGPDPFAPNGDKPILADDAGVSAPAPPVGTALATGPHVNFQTYSGRYGLGGVQALGKELRPYRRLITAQAFFRREVYAEQSQ